MSHDLRCILAAVDRRLEDAHQQWHEAQRVYFNPDKFRVAIQALIQTLRTVTFILQSNKTKIPHFDTWYDGWQVKLRADDLMRWMVDARNKIEKQGDLEAHSFVKAEVIASYTEKDVVLEVPAELWQAPWRLLKNIPKNALGDHLRKNGVLRIQRRWIENSLPGFELLEATAHAYGRLAELVRDAHRQAACELPVLSIDECGGFGGEMAGGRPPCMLNSDESRSLLVKIEDGTHLSLATHTIKIDKAITAESLEERYGLNVRSVFGDGKADIEGMFRSIFRAARHMLVADGHHMHVFFLLRGTEDMRIIRVDAENQAEKYLLMRRVADEVRKRDADAFVTIAEAWTATYDPARPFVRAGERADRREVLTGYLVRKEGRSLQLVAEIIRTDAGLTLSENQETEVKSEELAVFAPILEVWRKPT